MYLKFHLGDFEIWIKQIKNSIATFHNTKSLRVISVCMIILEIMSSSAIIIRVNVPRYLLTTSIFTYSYRNKKNPLCPFCIPRIIPLIIYYRSRAWIPLLCTKIRLRFRWNSCMGTMSSSVFIFSRICKIIVSFITIIIMVQGS